MECPNCQFENIDGMNFCGKCGTKLEQVCPQCHFPNPAEYVFCGKCGQKFTSPSEPTLKDLSFDEKLDKIQRYLPKGLTEKIIAQRGRIEGERKQVTVMFCDMEKYSQLSERLGPEDAYDIMDQVYEILIHKVHDYEGTVNEMTGDGIMALFGAPIALEDAPQRAIRSAFAIHREMAKLSDRLKQDKEGMPPLKMRIGIHTGPVVVGTLGNDLRVEFKAVGDTVNLASRIEGLAEPGTTWVTGDTFRLAEGLFRFENQGKKEVKGRAEPVNVYRVIAASSMRTRFDVSTDRGLTPFVGRERELELLLDCFERAKEGRGQACSIMAEAGVGKSRLLYEFRKAVANEDVTFLEGKCLSYSQGVPYHLQIDFLKANFNIREGEKDSEVREKVKMGLRVLGADESSTLPYLLELLSVKDSGIDDIALSPEARKAGIIDTFKQIFIKGSEIRPLILAHEDLHWVDRSSEDLLKNILESIPGARVFFIFTYRPEFVHTWGGKSFHSQVTLNRLSNRESLAMVAHVLGTEDLDRELEELILEKTEGIPFFIEEFLKSLKDLKIIERKENKYCLTKNIKDLAIPSAIQDVIMARVDSLPEGGKDILQTGSVVGREFSQNLIELVMGLSERLLLSHLSLLKDAELLYERGIYPQSTYIFKHALIQDAVYQSLLKNIRQRYHRKIAQALEKHFPESIETHPELLAHHYTEAGIVEQAIPYWKKAGEIAISRSAEMEAINHLSKGLDLLGSLPETPQRNQTELELQLALGTSLAATRGFGTSEVEKVYDRACQLCEKVGETPQLFRSLFGMWLYYLSKELHKAQEIGEQLRTLSQNSQETTLNLQAHHALWTHSLFLGNFVETLEHAEQGLLIYDPQQHHSQAFIYGGHDPGVCCRYFGAKALWFLGYPDQALHRINEAVNLAQKLSHQLTLAIALAWAAQIHQFRREPQATQKQAEAAIALSREQGFAMFLNWATIMQGWAIAAQGGEKEGIIQMCRCKSADLTAVLGVHKPILLAYLAETYGRIGNTDEGMTALAEAMVSSERIGANWWMAEVHRLKGDLLLKHSSQNLMEVEKCYHCALDVAHTQKARSLELRAAMSMSRLWQQQGKQEDASELLSETYGWFTEGFDTADLKEAKALLEELSA